MAKAVIRNTFEAGMNLDAPEYLMPSGSYSYARNAVEQTREHRSNALTNEQANELAASFGGRITGTTHIDERNQTLVFVYNGASELHLFNHSDHSTEFVCSDAEFGCDWGFDKCEDIYGEFKYFNNCYEQHVYWSSECIYHVVNIGEMLDPARKAAIKANEDCDYFDVFRCICGPKLSATPVENNGATLEGGSVSFSVQLEDNDGNTTNWFDISQEVKIETEDNTAGQIGTQSARLVIDNLDKKYDKVNIAVIKTVAGVTTAEKVASRSYSDKGITFEYYGQKGQLMDVAVLTTKAKAFLRGQDLLQKDGRMYYYSIKNERNLNYQKYANELSVEWVEWEVTAEMMRKYHFPTLVRGEVYAIGIVWKFCDGTYSPVFHIPGNPTAVAQGPATSEDQKFDLIISKVLNGESAESGGGSIGSQGGSVSFGNCTISCGAGTFPQGTQITITDYQNGSGTRLNNKWDLYSPIYDITSTGTQAGPLTLSISDVDYNPSVGMYRFKGDKAYQVEGEKYDEKTRTLSVQLNSLSAYAAAGASGASSGGGSTGGIDNSAFTGPDCFPCTINVSGVQAAGSDFISGGGTGDNGYSPMEVSDFKQDEEFERKRNPSKVEDRPEESDKVEEDVLDNLNNWDTLEQSYKDIAECGACTRECWCKEDCCQCGMTVTETCSDGVTCTSVYECTPEEEEQCDCSAYPDAVNNDLDEYSKIERNNQEAIALYGRDHDDPDINRNGNLRDSAKDLVDNAVINREYMTKKRPTLNYSDSASPQGSGTSPNRKKNEQEPSGLDKPAKFRQEGVGESNIREPERSNAASLRGDNWVDGFGNNLTEEPPRITGSGQTEAYVSDVMYPDATDCDGNFFYPQTNVMHHRIPWADERPHFTSYQNGVVNKFQPENDEWGNSYVRPIGIRVRNIKFPEPDELPKPLCPNSPYKIVYVKRTPQNKSVFAKGWFSGIFEGDVYGKTYAFPRHGVNSFEHVDRFIAAGGDGTSRLGSKSTQPMYTFHSPDTDADNSYLPVTHVRPELSMKGNGWRHGLYAEGKKPTDQWAGTRIDQKGARVANNLNHYDQSGGGLIDVSGLTYAEADKVITPPEGIDLPLMNRYREKSVYLQTSGNLPGDGHDESFVGDVLTHFAPTKCTAPYGALVRDVKDQYGSVEGLTYIDLGLEAHKGHYNASGIEGICGDAWIGLYSKRRTSYVSNKVGDKFDVEIKPGSPCRPRSICDTPDDKIFQYLGINHYPTKLPKSGDKWDAKNYAGLHTVGGGSCGHLSRNPSDAAAANTSESDWYYPGTLKSLTMCWVESQVNPWLLSTGEGSQIDTGHVYYPKLKDLYLDSAVTGSPWEESFLNRFYAKVEQPSLKQLAKKALIRTVLNIIIPALGLTQLQELETVMDGTTLFVVFPMLAAMWILGNNTLFTDRRLNDLLGIGDCRRDEEGGDLEEHVENWEDSYCKYNFDYSKVSDTQNYHAFPNNYNTCDCDTCDKSNVNSEIYHTNKQIQGSEIDAYRNVKINNYKEIPSHAGKVKRLFIQGNKFYAHTTDGIWLLQVGREQVPGDIGTQLTGSGTLMAEPIMLFEGVREGHAGTEDPNAGINTSMGYFFIDRAARKVYRFNGQIEEISAYGMFNFFKNNIEYCEGKDCFDEQDPRDVHYALGWDSRFNRLLVTKIDGDKDASWTVSYTPLGQGDRGKWLSFHDYKPMSYLWDRANMYSVTENEIWVHHVPNKYQEFYGEKSPFMVQFSAVSEDLRDWSWEYMEVKSYAEKASQGYFIKDLDDTFNKTAIWNSTQGTGEVDTEIISDDWGKSKDPIEKVKHNPNKIRFHKERRTWRVNEYKDLIKDGCSDQPLLKAENPCQPIPDINNDIFDCSILKRQNFKNRILHDTFHSYRFTYDKSTDTRLTLLYVDSYDANKTLDR